MAYVKCNECGQEYFRITALHLWTAHKMTMKEYRSKYPGATIISEDDPSFTGVMTKKFANYPKFDG